MNATQVLQELEELGTEQNRKVYRRHGVGDSQFGVSMANLEHLRKKIKKDHPLALALWSSANHDARMLATKIADPLLMDEPTIACWANDLQNYVLTDSFVDLLIQTAQARQLAENWLDVDHEWTSRAGWHLLAHLAMKDQQLSNTYFEKYLNVIGREIHQRKNRVREAMNNALIAIGIRNEDLEIKATLVAEQIGKVVVDHGETNCKTPAAIPYIRKARLHQKTRQMKNTKER